MFGLYGTFLKSIIAQVRGHKVVYLKCGGDIVRHFHPVARVWPRRLPFEALVEGLVMSRILPIMKVESGFKYFGNRESELADD